MSTAIPAAPMPVASPARVRAPARAPEGGRRLSLLLLAAAVATLVTVADQVIDTWADGHLVLAWVLLWVVVFAGMALFADTARRLARRGMAALDRWSRTMAEARAEMRLWEMAKQDPRLMSELMAARTRAEVPDASGTVDVPQAEAARPANPSSRPMRFVRMHYI